MQKRTTFYNNADFNWTIELKKNFDIIKEELLSLLNDNHQPKDNANSWFHSYPSYTHSDSTNKAWQTLNFMFWGIKNLQNRTLCPNTIKALDCVPNLISAEFSLLQPHTKVLPHKGYSKMVLRSHLALIIPDETKCAIKIESDTKHWKEGEVIIFDDSLMHEAWNDSDKVRVVLMFDFAAPDSPFTKEEICKYKLKNMDDEFLLKLAPREKWLECLKNGYFS